MKKFLQSLLIALTIISAYSSILKPQVNDSWSIPSCAWTRPLGDHPAGAAGRTKRGIPLGGIGAGNFMYNLCGTFGPWELKTGTHEEKFLSQAAFHLFEQIPGHPPVVKTLATEDVLPGWNKISPGSGNYSALYPKAWFSYQGTHAEIILKQFSPIIPRNYKESSYPVGVFQFYLANPTPDTLAVSIMFTFPNAGYGNDKRVGLHNQAYIENGTRAIVMNASSDENGTTTQNTEWCIATEENFDYLVSYCTSWDGNGTGSDIYSEFSDDGILSNTEIDTSFSAAAIAVKVILGPGAVNTIPLVLSWDFPIVRFGSLTEWYRRYTEYFGTAAGHALQIAEEGLSNLTNWENQVDNWQNLIINEAEYPDWLKQAALNELYYDTFGGVFWENGCITKPEESSFGTLPADDHKYFSMECNEYRFCETFDVRHYEARHYLELWPEIERDVLKWFSDYIYNTPSGSAPHDAGSPDSDPFFAFSGYGGNWQDMPSKFIEQAYAYFKKTNDTDFLDFVWPACVKTYNYMKTHDSNNNGLPDNGNTTYDTWGLYGDNLLCGGLWIGALEAMEQMALVRGENDFSNQLKEEYSDAKVALDTLLWDDDLQYFKIYPASTAIMADGLNGQRYCETSGLDPVLPAEKITSHLNKVFDLCVAPLHDYTGDGIGDLGAVNGRTSAGGSLGGGQPSEVWTGSSYFIAAMMYHWGKQMNDEQLKERALKTAYGVYYTTWINEQTAYFFNTPEAWNSSAPTQYRAQQYQRPRAVWELLLEIKNPFDTITSVRSKRNNEKPESYLLQNYPNPFNSATNFEFRISDFPAGSGTSGFVSLKVYDVLGNEVATLVNEEKTAGTYTINFNASNLSSGVYFYSLKSGNFYKTRKFILLK
ncbi:MAG TPA: GH116 family glycosyl-hydrolase [Ignavibacteriaceae bacterium]|nr:GH116 family glycosyl-hydrolase [Ignavibacteriaceae bacterium]